MLYPGCPLIPGWFARAEAKEVPPLPLYSSCWPTSCFRSAVPLAMARYTHIVSPYIGIGHS